MGSGSVWLGKDQLTAFIESRGGRMQTATALWQLITTRFPDEIREVYGRDVFEFRPTDGEGDVEVSLASLREAMNLIDPCWIFGYGQPQHRWLKEWLASFA
jgi:hypothetical protein